MRGAVGNLDVAQIVLYAFFIFFAGLIFYLRREDRREGYPLESEASGGVRTRDVFWIPPPKTFLRADGHRIAAPRDNADTRPVRAVKTEVWPGAPLTPVGDPLWRALARGASRSAPTNRQRPMMGTTSSRRSGSQPTSRSGRVRLSGRLCRPGRATRPCRRRPRPMGRSRGILPAVLRSPARDDGQARACARAFRRRRFQAARGARFRAFSRGSSTQFRRCAIPTE